MSSGAFLSIIPNEPPPLDTSEDEDSEEVPGLKLDLSDNSSVDPPPPINDVHQSENPTKDGPSDVETSQTGCADNCIDGDEDDDFADFEYSTVQQLQSATATPSKTQTENPVSSSIETEKVVQTSVLLEDEDDDIVDFECSTVKQFQSATPSQTQPENKVSSSIEKVVEASQLPKDEDDDIADFECLTLQQVQSAIPSQSQPKNPASSSTETENVVQTSQLTKDEDDDIADSTVQQFQSATPSQTQPENPASSSTEKVVQTLQLTEDEDDDIADSTEQQFQSATPSQTQPVNPVSSSIETENVVKTSQLSEDEDDDIADSTVQKFQSATPSQTQPENPASSTIEKVVQTSQLPEDEDDDFADFECSTVQQFQSATPSQSQPENPVSSTIEKVIQTSQQPEDEDDEFADFECSTVPQFQSATPSQSQPENPVSSTTEKVLPEDEDDDFADFQDFSDPTPSASSAPPPERTRSISFSFLNPRLSADFSATLESKFENLVKFVLPPEEKEAIPEDQISLEEDAASGSSGFRSIDKELKEEGDPHWAHVHDFEESKGLLFKWLNSQCQQKLYRSLNIDTSTVVYTERWGAIEVPKFASSLGDTPLLQPQICPSANSSRSKEGEVENGPQRRSSGSDDTQDSKVNKPLSAEAQRILQQIPDISFMKSKTLVFPQAASSTNSLL